MSQDKGVFAGDKKKPGRTDDKRKAGGAADRGRTPARPLAELRQRQAREEARAGTERPSLRQRIGRAFPLFGMVGPRELGLILAIVGGTTAMWPVYRAWGFLIAGLGFVVMRYGEGWLRGRG